MVINFDGMAFIGPGSEWFWTMLQFLALAITFYAIYRQLRAQRAAAATQRMEAWQEKWFSDSLIHARLTVAIWRKHAASPSPTFEARAALNLLCTFFEDLGTLEAAGYVTWKEVEATWGEGLVMYWALLGPTVMELRASMPSAYAEFERLAKRADEMARRRGEDWSVPESAIPELVETQIGVLTAWLRMSRDIATGVIPADPSSVITSAPVPG